MRYTKIHKYIHYIQLYYWRLIAVGLTEQVITRRDDMPLADSGGSASVRRRIRSPHSSRGLQGSCGAAGLGAT